MKTLLFTFPSRGGTTSIWNYLKQHPEIYPSQKKFMNTSDGGWLYWSKENILEEHWKLHPPDEYYKNYESIDENNSGVWMDGTDDVLDKKYLSLLKIKLKKFNRFCAIYTLRNPFSWYLSFYVYFQMGQYSLFTDGSKKEHINEIVIPKYNLNHVINNLDFFKNEFFTIVPKISYNLFHLYSKFNKEDIWIDYLENIVMKQSYIFNWLKIDPLFRINEFPHLNTTMNAMFLTFGSFEVYNFWKELVFTDKDIREWITKDCEEVKNQYGIDLISTYRKFFDENSF